MAVAVAVVVVYVVVKGNLVTEQRMRTMGAFIFWGLMKTAFAMLSIARGRLNVACIASTANGALHISERPKSMREQVHLLFNGRIVSQ